MFLGTYDYSIDAKGRLFIPAKLREGNETRGGRFILTKGLEGCLYLYDPDVFQRVVLAKLENLPVKNQQDARAFKRLLLSGAQEVVIDDMGRILVPRNHVEFAGLKKATSIIGVGERIEIWSTVRWTAYNRKASTTFEKLGRHLDI